MRSKGKDLNLHVAHISLVRPQQLGKSRWDPKGATEEGVGLEENTGTRFSLCEQRTSLVVRVWKQSVESMPRVLVELNKLHHKALPCKQLLFSNTVTTT